MPAAGRRALFGALGIAAVGLGVIGVWIPGLPTTPFILLALWASARSSPGLSTWLRRLPVLRSAVAAADAYERDRTLPLSVKLLAQFAAWGSALIVLIVTGSWWIGALVACAAAACTAFMVRTPTTPR